MTQPDITKADREAACRVPNVANGYTKGGGFSDGYWIRAGKYDDHPVVQIIASLDRAGYERGVRESAGVAQGRADYFKMAADMSLPVEPSPTIARDRGKVATGIAALQSHTIPDTDHIPDAGKMIDIDTMGSHFGNGGTFDPIDTEADRLREADQSPD